MKLHDAKQDANTNVVSFSKNYHHLCTSLLQKGNHAFKKQHYDTSTRLYSSAYSHANTLLSITSPLSFDDYDNSIALVIVSGKNLAESYLQRKKQPQSENIMQELVKKLIDENKKVEDNFKARMCLLLHMKHAMMELLRYTDLLQKQDGKTFYLIEETIHLSKSLLKEIHC